jgi:hypothetical protein
LLLLAVAVAVAVAVAAVVVVMMKVLECTKEWTSTHFSKPAAFKEDILLIPIT